VTKQPARGHNSLADGGLGSAPLQRAVGFLRQQHVPQATSKSGNLAITMNKSSSSFGSVKDHAGALAAAGGSGAWGHRDIPILSRAEAMASTAVRAADKVQAKLVRSCSGLKEMLRKVLNWVNQRPSGLRTRVKLVRSCSGAGV